MGRMEFEANFPRRDTLVTKPQLFLKVIFPMARPVSYKRLGTNVARVRCLFTAIAWYLDKGAHTATKSTN